MKKIVPFKKDIIFNTDISEIVSISLEHTLQSDNNLVTGNFVVSGDYRISETSVNTEDFSYDLPFSINVDDKYILDNAIIDIDDFYYEITNNNVLNVNIDVLIDRLEEKELERPVIEERIEQVEEVIEEPRCIEEETNIFDNIDSTDTYKSYTVYIVREGDTIESIMTKYSIEKELIIEYNDISELSIGDKIIIPC